MITEVEARDDAAKPSPTVRALWRLRIARRLLDAVAEEQRVVSILDDLDVQLAEAQVEQRDRLARWKVPISPASSERWPWPGTPATADARHRGALGDVARHETGLDGLIERIRALTTKALAPAGISVDEAEAGEARASRGSRRTRSVGAAEADLRRARADLATVTEHGEADPAARRSLEAAGVDAAPLLDAVVLDSSSREQWEPVLAPWRAADIAGCATRPGRRRRGSWNRPRRRRPRRRGPASGRRAAGTARHRPLPDDVARPPADALRRCGRRAVIVAGGFGAELWPPMPPSPGPEATLTAAEELHEYATRRLDAAPTRPHPRSRRPRPPPGRGQGHAGLHARGAPHRGAGRRPAGARRRRSGADSRHARRSSSPGAAGDLDPQEHRPPSRLSPLRPGGSPRSRTRSAPHAAVGRLDVDGCARRGRTPTPPQSPRSTATIARRARCEACPPRAARRRPGADRGRLAHRGRGTDPGDRRRRAAPGGPRRAGAAAYEVRRFDTVTRPLEDWLEDQLESDTSFRQEVEIERAVDSSSSARHARSAPPRPTSSIATAT